MSKKNATKKTSKKPAAPRTPPKRKTQVERQVERLARQQELELAQGSATGSETEQTDTPTPTQIDNVDYYGGTKCAEWIEQTGEARGYITVAMMYLFRCGNKPGSSAEDDLKKTKWFLQRLQKVQPDIVNDATWQGCKNALFALAEKHEVNLYDTESTVEGS